MMCNIKEETIKVEVKSEDNLDTVFLPENKHSVSDSMDSIVEDYNRFEVKKEFKYIDYDELNTDSLIQVNATYDNFKCKEEIKDEGQTEVSNIFITEKNEADEEIDISETILQSSDNFKLESDNNTETQKAFAQTDDAPLKCQFCTESFKIKLSLDGHLLRKHKDNIKNDIKSFITSKIHVCRTCNSFETTNISNFNRHMNSVHNTMKMKKKCKFCTVSLLHKRSLEEHVLKKHKDKIKNDIKSFITTKIHACKTCNSFETTNKTDLKRHINSLHNEVKIKLKCQFCTESFIGKRSLDAHLLRKHKNIIKNDIKSFITTTIHVCRTCNSFETTNKSQFKRHINSVHNKGEIKLKCKFCTVSVINKRSLDEHVLRKHSDQIKNELKNVITSKIHVCNICNSFETTNKSKFDRHINTAHNEVETKMSI